MNNLARVRSGRGGDTQLEEGIVTQVAQSPASGGDGGLVVRTSIGPIAAKRAKSCLVRPDVGDAVLVSFTGDRVFVLAVLEGADDAPSSLVVEGDLDLRVEGGRLAITASRGVDIVTGGELGLTAERLSAHALEGQLVIDKLDYVGTAVHAEVCSIKSTAVTCDVTYDRLCERVKNGYKFVEESDVVKAERIDHAASEEILMRSKNCVVAATELMKVDAEQIQLG